jgi:hypothetical protein
MSVLQILKRRCNITKQRNSVVVALRMVLMMIGGVAVYDLGHLSFQLTKYRYLGTTTATVSNNTATMTTTTTTRSSLSLSLPSSSFNYRQYQSPDRFLYLHRTATSAGLNNQLECIHLAANLALRYNRTLLIMKDAFQGDIRFYQKLGFDDVFEDTTALPILVSLLNDTRQLLTTSTTTNGTTQSTSTNPFKNCLENRIEKMHKPDDPIQQSPLGNNSDSQLYNNQRCVSFHCGWAHLHLSAPKERFPYVDDDLLPLNKKYIQIADKIVAEMGHRQHFGRYYHNNTTKTTTITDKPNVLGVHIRGGDNPGHPIVDCTKTMSYRNLAVKKYLNGGRKWGVFCSKSENPIDGGDDILNWEQFLRHLSACDGEIPICIDDYDAVYIATNDDRFKTTKKIRTFLNSTKLFFLHDFAFVDSDLKRHFVTDKKNRAVGVMQTQQREIARRTKSAVHALHYFLLEEAILMRVSNFQASVPSSVSDIVYHYRQEMGQPNDVEMYAIWNSMNRKLLAAGKDVH